MKKLRLILTIIECVFLLLLSAWQIAAQDKCDHVSDSIKRFENIRILPPARIVDYTGRQIEVVLKDARSIEVKTMFIDGDTALPKDFAKTYKKGEWWICFCIVEKKVYFIERVEKSQQLRAK